MSTVLLISIIVIFFFGLGLLGYFYADNKQDEEDKKRRREELEKLSKQVKKEKEAQAAYDQKHKLHMDAEDRILQLENMQLEVENEKATLQQAADQHQTQIDAKHQQYLSAVAAGNATLAASLLEQEAELKAQHDDEIAKITEDDSVLEELQAALAEAEASEATLRREEAATKAKLEAEIATLKEEAEEDKAEIASIHKEYLAALAEGDDTKAAELKESEDKLQEKVDAANEASAESAATIASHEAEIAEKDRQLQEHKDMLQHVCPEGYEWGEDISKCKELPTEIKTFTAPAYAIDGYGTTSYCHFGNIQKYKNDQGKCGALDKKDNFKAGAQQKCGADIENEVFANYRICMPGKGYCADDGICKQGKSSDLCSAYAAYNEAGLTCTIRENDSDGILRIQGERDVVEQLAAEEAGTREKTKVGSAEWERMMNAVALGNAERLRVRMLSTAAASMQEAVANGEEVEATDEAARRQKQEAAEAAVSDAPNSGVDCRDYDTLNDYCNDDDDEDEYYSTAYRQDCYDYDPITGQCNDIEYNSAYGQPNAMRAAMER